MTSGTIKTSIKIGIAASFAIILFQVSDILLVYHYFKFEYYVTVVAVVFLVAGYLVSKYQQPGKTHEQPGQDPLSGLTIKELAILQLIAEGKSNKEIAAENFVEISTVKTHINNIYAKLGISNRKGAVALFKSYLANDHHKLLTRSSN